jgi:dTDP-4-amino-4,6-dideoxygalactose transaminase
VIAIARPALGEEEMAAVRDVLASGRLAQGPKVAAFEERFARYVKRRHAVAVNSGTAALYLALTALDVGAGDEVVVPPLTFFASASTVAACGGLPRFADVEEGTYTMDAEDVEGRIGQATKALMPVDLYGQVATMEPLLDLAEARELRVVEDACQAHGATYRDRPAGSFGDVACFSFYATKNMTTGEGGMIVTDDEEIADSCRLLRDQGQRRKYEHVRLGYNLRMTEIAAAIGLVQLGKLDAFVAQRRRNAARLTEGLQDVSGLVLPREAPDRRHSFYQYVVRVEGGFPLTRDALVAHLNRAGVGARPSYPKPLYAQEALRGLVQDRCPRAEALIPQLVELPVHPLLREDEVDAVIAAVRTAAGGDPGGTADGG